MKTIQYLLFFLAGMAGISACSDLLEVDSDKHLTFDDHTLNSPNDSVYSLLGILSGMQDLAGKYFVLGELRGELAEVTSFSDRYLREINNHETLSKDNPYADLTPYYRVINNCNYMIAKIDTIVGNSALLPDYAAAVKIRAWTYFQLAKNYASVRYYLHPIVTVSDAQKAEQYPLLSLQEIIGELIPQIEAVQQAPDPAFSISDIPVGRMIPSAYYLLGDLYLWQGNYDRAAYYYKLMMQSGQRYFYICDDTFPIIYSTTGVSFPWRWIFSPSDFSYSSEFEVTCGIYYHYTAGKEDLAMAMCKKEGSIQATDIAAAKWLAQRPENPNISEYVRPYGDWRGSAWQTGNSFSWDTASIANPPFFPKEDIKRIMKHEADTASGGRIILERAGLLALRYAEAVNRMGKPTLALAAVNVGLKQSIVNDSSLIVNPGELATGGYIIDFNYAGYNYNLGVRGRVGLTPYVFPGDLYTLQDSIRFVEDKIIEELALETAFEGNRWTDLLRIALRRIDRNETGARDFLPNIVGPKFEASGEAAILRERLKNRENFFLHYKP